MTDVSLSDVSASGLKLLKRAAKTKRLSVFYPEGLETARELEGRGLLEFLHYGEYIITPTGRAFLVENAAFAPAAAPKTAATPETRKPRRPTAQHVPQGAKPSLRPKRFAQLSERQKAILRFIDRFARDIGYPPTIREICEDVGITSTSVTDYNIRRLIECGWLDRTDGISRGIRLIQELPNRRTKSSIQVDHGVLRISVNLGAEPEAIVEMAQAGIERLQEIIAAAKAGV